MSKSLFDHIKAVTSEQNPNYWETLDEGDKKTWSNYMIHRFLSMNPDWIQVLSEIQPYTQVLEPKQLYLALIGLLPKGKYYLKYTKGKNGRAPRRCDRGLATVWLRFGYGLATVPPRE